MIQTLHITNSQVLTKVLKKLQIQGTFLTWQEMLCEGPTTEEVDSQRFFSLRKKFLWEYYDIELNEEEFRTELQILNQTERFDEIVLWFDFDLFSHINLMAVISCLKQKKVKAPLFLVTGGRIKGEKDLQALINLKPEQLRKVFLEKLQLTEVDKDLMTDLWRIYCGTDHNLFKPFIVEKSNFPYLSSCLKAHLERFPDSRTGLSTLETHTLHMIADRNIKSRRHLKGYILNFQGYYGFGDLQIDRMIASLNQFYLENPNEILLNRDGYEALEGLHDYFEKLQNDIRYGGVQKKDFKFDRLQNKLIKIN